MTVVPGEVTMQKQSIHLTDFIVPENHLQIPNNPR